MERLLVAVAIVLVAVAVSQALRRRRPSDPPTQAAHSIPSQLDRRDFSEVDAPWLVAVFTSASCSTCADVAEKAQVLRSDSVAVEVVEFGARRDLHERYGIDAVPCLVVAGADGSVAAGFLGPVTATDLWAAVADAREPGSVRQADGCQGDTGTFE
ncbi:MAG: hypothetical protein O2925_06700 [Actinomycetota bacterium]|nr:hypothetical protein [Actinomycetota bacterium]MDA3014781.1 hypothetical protein [Actinomycetota bacterium]MDA3028472.1 hypothetical protein [Actinomycetota bacterium]